MTRDALIVRHNTNCRAFQTDLDQTDALLATNERSKVTLSTSMELDAGFDCSLYVEGVSLS